MSPIMWKEVSIFSGVIVIKIISENPKLHAPIGLKLYDKY